MERLQKGGYGQKAEGRRQRNRVVFKAEWACCSSSADSPSVAKKRAMVTLLDAEKLLLWFYVLFEYGRRRPFRDVRLQF